MSQTIDLFANPQQIHGQPRRTCGGLLIAVALHVILLALPSPLPKDRAPGRTLFQLTITRPPEVKAAPVPEVTQPMETKQMPKPEPPADIQRKGPSSQEPIQTQKDPDVLGEEISNSIDQPAAVHQPNTGAKSRSTVFDPRLARKLADERNRVQKFESGNTEYMTTTGTFIQRGDRCWEVKQLIPGDTSSESSQWLRIKCPKTSRSKSDIDRLARKYGIP